MALPAILQTPMDPARDPRKQVKERFTAAYRLFQQPCPPHKEIPPMVVALVQYSFPECFAFKATKLDPRCKVKRVQELRTVVKALVDGFEEGLTDPDLKKLALRVRGDLQYRGKSRAISHICTSISKVATNEWKGLRPSVLRDNVYRHPNGNGPLMTQKKMIAALKDVARKIDQAPDNVFEHPI